jgi:hypothetical protein
MQGLPARAWPDKQARVSEPRPAMPALAASPVRLVRQVLRTEVAAAPAKVTVAGRTLAGEPETQGTAVAAPAVAAEGAAVRAQAGRAGTLVAAEVARVAAE